MALFGLPAFLLGLLELALRLGGYGYPTSFFVPRQVNGTNVLAENAQFAWRFFPPALARTPSPVLFRPQKPPGVYRIFLFGESAAMGDPRPAYGAGRYLEVLLGERFPKIKFEVVCTAMTAINSHSVLPIAQECAGYQGDLWVVYMGNNEMIGPFGANTVFGLQAPPRLLIRAELAAQQTRTGQWLMALARRVGKEKTSPASWTGLKMFRETQLPPSDPRKDRVYASFSANVRDILKAAQKVGVPVVLSSVASNLKDCAPFGSIHAATLPPSRLAEFQQVDAAAAGAAQRRDWVQAQELYTKATALSPEFADAHFGLGQCLLATTNLSAARHALEAARDLDALPVRADSQLNARVARAATNSPGVVYVDAVECFAQQSPARVPGQEFFFEHVHLNPEGNYQLARAWAAQIETFLPRQIGRPNAGQWAAADLCARRLGLTDWNRSTMLEEIGQRLIEPPYTDQSDHAAQSRHLANELVQVRSRLTSDAASEARVIYEEAIQRRPEDHWLRQNYAEFLTATGDLPKARTQLERVVQIIPHHPSAYYFLGRLLARLKDWDAARQSLQTALRLRPNYGEAWLELAQVCANQQKLEEALQDCVIAQRYRPNDAGVHLLRAHIFEDQNKRSEAIASLREAVRLRPSAWEAHQLLGTELALTGDFAGGQMEFEQVVRLRPDFASGHLRLALALARQGNLESALEHLQESVRLEPGNVEAKNFLESIRKLKSESPR